MKNNGKNNQKHCKNNGNCSQCDGCKKGRYYKGNNNGELNEVKPQTSISASYQPKTNPVNNDPYIDFKKLYKIVMRLGVQTKIKRFFNTGKNNAVLIIKRDGIGDFILFLDAFKRLKEFYKGKKFVVCVTNYTKPIAEECGLFDEVIALSKNDFTTDNIYKTYKLLSKYKFDVLLHPTQPRNIESEVTAYLVNAKVKIASRGELGAHSPKTKAKFDTIYDKLLETGNENMTLIQTANFIRALGDTEYKISMPRIKPFIDFNMYLPENFFVIFMGGSIYNKLWPAERFYQVAKHISEKTGYECVICGTKEDYNELEIFKSQGDLKFSSLIGKTSIIELITVLSKAKLLVSNDTSAVHIANALGVKSLAIKGQFSGSKFYPYVVEKENEGDIYPNFVEIPTGCRWCTLKGKAYHCIGGNYFAAKKLKCIMGISTEKVIEAVDNLLNEN